MKEQFKQLLLDETRDLLKETPSIDDVDIAISLLRVLGKVLWNEVSEKRDKRDK